MMCFVVGVFLFILSLYSLLNLWLSIFNQFWEVLSILSNNAVTLFSSFCFTQITQNYRHLYSILPVCSLFLAYFSFFFLYVLFHIFSSNSCSSLLINFCSCCYFAFKTIHCVFSLNYHIYWF